MNFASKEMNYSVERILVQRKFGGNSQEMDTQNSRIREENEL